MVFAPSIAFVACKDNAHKHTMNLNNQDCFRAVFPDFLYILPDFPPLPCAKCTRQRRKGHFTNDKSFIVCRPRQRAHDKGWTAKRLCRVKLAFVYSSGMWFKIILLWDKKKKTQGKESLYCVRFFAACFLFLHTENPSLPCVFSLSYVFCMTYNEESLYHVSDKMFTAKQSNTW